MSEWILTTDSAIASINLFFQNILYYLKILVLLALPALVVGGGVFMLIFLLEELALLFTVPAVIIAYLWFFFCWIALILIWRAIIEHNEHLPLTFALSKAKESFFPFIGLALLSLVISLSLYGVGLGILYLFTSISMYLLFLMIPIIVAVIYLALRLALAPIILVLESYGPIESLGESWRISQGRALKLFVGTLIAGFPSIFFAILTVLIRNGSPILSVACNILSSLLGITSTIFLVHYYLQLRKRENEFVISAAPTQPPAVG